MHVRIKFPKCIATGKNRINTQTFFSSKIIIMLQRPSMVYQQTDIMLPIQ